MSKEERDRIIEEADELYNSGRIYESIEVMKKHKNSFDKDMYIGMMLDIGFELDEKDDVRCAFECFKEAAKMGDITAMKMLGTYYGSGKGCKQDNRECFYWYKKAYDAHPYSALALNLAYCYLNCYFNGEAIEKDLNYPLSLFKEAMQCDDYDIRKDAQEGYEIVINEINNAEKKEKWKNRGKTALNVLGAFAQGYANASSQYDDDYDD